MDVPRIRRAPSDQKEVLTLRARVSAVLLEIAVALDPQTADKPLHNPGALASWPARRACQSQSMIGFLLFGAQSPPRSGIRMPYWGLSGHIGAMHLAKIAAGLLDFAFFAFRHGTLVRKSDGILFFERNQLQKCGLQFGI